MLLTDIKPNPKNPRLIRDDKFKKLVQSIKEFPKMMELRPIIVDSDNMILGGNMRFKALKELGYKDIADNWVKRADELSEDEKKRFIVVDNVGFGDNDYDILAADYEMDDLLDWGMDELDFGIDEDEATEIQEDEAPEVSQSEPISKLGDLWEIGKHRVLCGDCTNILNVEKLMDGQIIDITFTSPPYNVGMTPNGNKQKYLNDEDNKSLSEYLDLIQSATKNSLIASEYVFFNIQSIAGNKIALIEYLYNLREYFADYIIWDKTTAEPAMASNVLNSKFEFIYCFSKKANRSMGVKEFRGTLENIIYINSRQNKECADIHKATFPVDLPVYFINNFSKKSVLDLFLGTGTTLIACEQLNRVCYGLELDERYSDVIVKRWINFMMKNGKESEIKIKLNDVDFDYKEFLKE
jgi:site-specific DNA-methyltransferase (adenine-specific)